MAGGGIIYTDLTVSQMAFRYDMLAKVQSHKCTQFNYEH